jgi:hypothetical protein
MGTAVRHHPVKLILGLIANDPSKFLKVIAILKKKFGPIDFQSNILDFTYTKYYENEFGSGLKRQFVSFKKLIPPEELAKIKNMTNKLENKLSSDSRRTINIDPGYLDMAKLILASTKDHCHRIYIGYGIFAEITLFYQNKSFRHREWTYPDYRTTEYIEIFNRIRQLYQEQINKN